MRTPKLPNTEDTTTTTNDTGHETATERERLAAASDVDSTAWEIISTDDLVTNYTLTPSGIVNSHLLITAAGVAGTKAILQSTINGGFDKSTGQVNLKTTQATVAFWVPCAGNGAEVLCFDEHGESGPQWWMPIVNGAIRRSITPGSFDVNPTDNTVPVRDGTGQLRATTFATASSNVAASGALQLPAGAQIAVAIKGASHPTVALVSTESASTLALGDGSEITEVDVRGAALGNVASISNGGLSRSMGLASVTVAPGSTTILGPSIPLPTNTAWVMWATFTAHIASSTTIVGFHQTLMFQLGNVSGSLFVSPGVPANDSVSAWKVASPTQPWATTAANTASVTNVVNDGSGHCQVTVSTLANIRQGATITISGVVGTTEANGTFIVDSVSGTNIVLRGSSFVNAYVSGGTVTVQGCCTISAMSLPLQFEGVGLTPAHWFAGENVNRGDVRELAGKTYLYTNGGATAATGPSSTGTGITDGTATCDYLGVTGSVPVVTWTFAELVLIPT